jgi:hypothetical protein
MIPLVTVARAVGSALVYAAPGLTVTLLPPEPVAPPVVVRPLGLPLVSSMPAPTLAAAPPPAVVVSPPILLATVTTPAPVVGRGGVTSWPTPVVLALTTPAPSLQKGVGATVVPAPMSAGLTTPAPVLSVDGIAIAVSPVSIGSGLPEPAVERGTIAIAAPVVLSTSALPSPAVSAPAGASYDPAAEAAFAAMTVQPDATRKGLINDLIAGTIMDGVWTKLDWLNLLAAHAAQAARVNLRNPAKSLSAINAPTFTVDRGYSGDGSTSYLDLGEQFGFAGAQYGQNSATIGGWINLQGTGNGARPAIGQAGTSFAGVYARNNVGAATFKINDAVLTTLQTDPTSRLGHRTATRQAADSKVGYIAGAQVATAAVASRADYLTGGPASLLRDVAQYSPDRLAASYSGGGLAPAEVAALHARLSTYLTAIGAN